MESARIIRATRKGIGANQRDFSKLVSDALASGCTLGSISHWEKGRNQPNYEKAFYIWLHTDSPALRDMAEKIQAELNPVRWETDKQRFGNG